jgi:predicted AAA+ superfamily ATPase
MGELTGWKSRSRRKPLLLYGARQVGKTHLLNEFGRQYYSDLAYFNLEQSQRAAAIFDGELEPDRIIALLEAQRGVAIHPETTLVILDEIQKNTRAITALKYFYELAPRYHIAAAGSLLGITLGREDDSFPVGKVNSLTLYPLDFEEFLWAQGQELLAQAIRESYANEKPFALHETALELYRQYLVVGGMPESVLEFGETQGFLGFGEALREIDRDHIADMAKYAKAPESGRIIEAWESVPGQLRKANHKFQYNKIRSGARANQYEVPIAWLQTANIINKCVRADVMESPLSLTSDNDHFKIYLADTGLLCAKLGADPAQIHENTLSSAQFRGILAENYVMQHLRANNIKPYYWKSPGKAKVEFVIDAGKDGIIPLEVKSGDNVRSFSLQAYRDKYHPSYAVRFSTKNFGSANNIKSIPLYAAFCFK